jgi:hypothetical protein
MTTFFFERVIVYDPLGNAVPMDFALDTLASYSIITPPVVQQLGLQQTGTNVATGFDGGATQVPVTIVPISIRDRSPERAIMMIADAPYNVLGIDVIRAYGLLQQT